MEKSMEVPKGTKTRSTIFSSPTPRHISTKIITEQDTCTVCAHISVCARGCTRARAFAGEDGWGGVGVRLWLGLGLELVQPPRIA